MDRDSARDGLPFRLRQMFGRAPGNGQYIVESSNQENGNPHSDHYDVYTETTFYDYSSGRKPVASPLRLHFGSVVVNCASDEPFWIFKRDSNGRFYRQNLAA